MYKKLSFIFRRTHPLILPENRRKISGILIPHSLCNFISKQIRILQQLLRLVNALLVDVFSKGAGGRLFEGTA